MLPCVNAPVSRATFWRGLCSGPFQKLKAHAPARNTLKSTMSNGSRPIASGNHEMAGPQPHAHRLAPSVQQSTFPLG